MYETFNAFPLMHSKGIYEGSAPPQMKNASSSSPARLMPAAAQQRHHMVRRYLGNMAVFKNQILRASTSPSPASPIGTPTPAGSPPIDKRATWIPPNPVYQELFSRWFQFSAFCPMFRVHGGYGTAPGKEIWRFDAKTQASCAITLMCATA